MMLTNFCVYLSLCLSSRTITILLWYHDATTLLPAPILLYNVSRPPCHLVYRSNNPLIMMIVFRITADIGYAIIIIIMITSRFLPPAKTVVRGSSILMMT